MPAFALAIFTEAFLLFQVQPLILKTAVETMKPQIDTDEH